MTAPPIPYIGNGPYCYANATAMLLASVGEQISPARIEVLTGVGLGATWIPKQDVFFFSMEAPDVGVSRALELLGFTYLECASRENEQPPFQDLADALTSGPAVLGPVEMGLLTYMPGRGTPIGADHYVIAYALSDGEVHVHDPAGFPHVSLPLSQFEEAWRAELIGYRRGVFRWWTSPRRIHNAAEDDLVERAVGVFRGIYRQAETASRPYLILGTDAIRRLAGVAARGAPPPSLADHLVWFVFQLAARRALDYASFFEGYYPALAQLKQEQAVLFGRCHTRAVRGDWTGLACELGTLAEVEDRFREMLS